MPIKYEIEDINPKDSKELADIICKVFSKNPSEETDTDFKEYIEYLCFECAENDMGYLVRSADTNNIIGGVLCCDLANYFKSAACSSYADHDPWAALIKELNIKHFQGAEIAPNTYLNFQFIAVIEEFSGNGIATALVEKMLVDATGKGFSQAHVESVGSHSQHIFGTHFQFPTVTEIKCADFVFKNEKPLQTSASNESVKLMIKNLCVE